MNTVADIKAKFTIESVLASKGVEVKGGKARCPFHDDRTPSFSIKDGHWKCFAGCGSGDVVELLAKLEGKTSAEYLRNGNVTIADPRSKSLISKPRASKSEKPGRIVEVYPYHDAKGTFLYEVVRMEPKDFRQRRRVNDQWVWNMDGVELVPFYLLGVTTAQTVWIVEGEKDALSLIDAGYVATCNVGGAEKWRDSYNEHFIGKDVVLCGDNDDPGRRHMEQVEAALLPVAKSIRRVIVQSPAKDISEHLQGMDKDQRKVAVEALLNAPGPLDLLLNARRFDLANPPPKPVPVLTITDKPICTAGNLTVEQALAKAGKTSFEAACIASLMKPSGDCLGVVGQNPDELPVIHFDTEQSNYDHHEVIKQALARAGRSTEPEWLRSYRLADVPTSLRRKALAHEMKRAAINGKLCAVFLDGVADLCIDPNDSAEAFGLVEELHRLAITYHCPIICILHENPGSDTGKTRGHLGSQLERKAETNLRLSKDADGVTTIYTERSRHCHIPKEQGPRFAWDDVAGMHLLCVTTQDKRSDAKTQDMRRIFGDLFAQKDGYRHGELVQAYVAHQPVSERTAKSRIKDATSAGIIAHSAAMGLYSRGT